MRIILVEDAVKLALALKRGLEGEGYAVDTVHDGLTARKRILARDGQYDLLILDVMLPGLDGLTLCRDLRAQGVAAPVLMLTARDTTGDKVAGLDSGADDYLIKPFAFEELLARIRTLLRRPAQTLATELRVGDLVLDPAARTVRRGDHPVELTTKEFALLELFMRSPGEVLSRDTILDHAWDEDADAFSNIVDVYLRRLRKKIDRAGEQSLFQTVRGVMP
ncbi:MAG TPA: response regulator transcription factor [Thermoleophilia bacterium]|nr:response regulator transcription factor [Thermoleophilia bacterium]